MKAEKHTLTNALGGSLTLNLHPSKIRRTGDFKVEWTLSPKQWDQAIKASNQYPNWPWFTIFLEAVTFKCHLKDGNTRIFNQDTLRQVPSTTTTGRFMTLGLALETVLDIARLRNTVTARDKDSTNAIAIATVENFIINNSAHSDESKALASVLKRVMKWYTHTTKDTMPTQLFDEAFAALNTHAHTQERTINERTNNPPD